MQLRDQWYRYNQEGLNYIKLAERRWGVEDLAGWLRRTCTSASDFAEARRRDDPIPFADLAKDQGHAVWPTVGSGVQVPSAPANPFGDMRRLFLIPAPIVQET